MVSRNRIELAEWKLYDEIIEFIYKIYIYMLKIEKLSCEIIHLYNFIDISCLARYIFYEI